MWLPNVSIVLSTYNRRELLPTVLSPLLSDSTATEIVVIVDGSDDGSFELLTEMAEANDRLKPHLIPNAGKEGARQTGVERASGDVVLLLDDDVMAGPGLAAGHARHHAERGGLVVVGYMPVAVADKRQGAGVATALYAAEYEGLTKVYDRHPELVLRKLWGGNISLRRVDALRVGLQSAAYRASYHQDRDFGLRCLAAGLEGRFDRELRATHLHRRPLHALTRDARGQGAGLRQLHDLHPGELGAFEIDHFTRGLRAPVSTWVRASRRPQILDVSTRALSVAAGTAARLRLPRVELVALKLLRRMHQQAGALGVEPQTGAARRAPSA